MKVLLLTSTCLAFCAMAVVSAAELTDQDSTSAIGKPTKSLNGVFDAVYDEVEDLEDIDEVPGSEDEDLFESGLELGHNRRPVPGGRARAYSRGYNRGSGNGNNRRVRPGGRARAYRQGYQRGNGNGSSSTSWDGDGNRRRGRNGLRPRANAYRKGYQRGNGNGSSSTSWDGDGNRRRGRNGRRPRANAYRYGYQRGSGNGSSSLSWDGDRRRGRNGSNRNTGRDSNGDFTHCWPRCSPELDAKSAQDTKEDEISKSAASSSDAVGNDASADIASTK